MEVPPAIADTSGQLRTGNKSVVMELLSCGTERPRPHTSRRTIDISSSVADGEALVMRLG